LADVTIRTHVSIIAWSIVFENKATSTFGITGINRAFISVITLNGRAGALKHDAMIRFCAIIVICTGKDADSWLVITQSICLIARVHRTNIIVITALVSPFESDRQRARSIFEEGEFIEVFVDTPVDICMARDPKGLYGKASKGEIPNFTGVGQNYERPTAPDLHLDGTADLEANTSEILKLIL